jgi:prepilin-type N-terminal cleavage/methylation domain-containing protein/prepilin-type processing-associated H-X9-DG protein
MLFGLSRTALAMPKKPEAAVCKSSLMSKWRAAFTLSELLAVLAIIGLLFALLMPAIQAARESARMANCKNHLRQIGLALVNYESAHKHLPAGIKIHSDVECLDHLSREGINWMILILPFLEEQKIYSLYDQKYRNEAPQNEDARKSFVSIYNCPNDNRIGQTIVPAQGPVAPPAKANLEYMTGSYRGVSGFSEGIAFLDSNVLIGSRYQNRHRGVLHAVGVGVETYREERTNRGDGASNTLMVGESYTRNNAGVHTAWAYSFQFYCLSAVTKQSRAFGVDYEKCVSIFDIGASRPCQRGWSAGHPRLLNFAYADGSVHTLSDTIDLDVLACMATIAGGEANRRAE